MTEKRRRNSAILPAAPPPHPSAAENLPILLRSLVLILILIALLIIAVSLNSGSLIKSSLGMAKTCLVFVVVTRPIIGASVQNQLLSKISLIHTAKLNKYYETNLYCSLVSAHDSVAPPSADLPSLGDPPSSAPPSLASLAQSVLDVLAPPPPRVAGNIHDLRFREFWLSLNPDPFVLGVLQNGYRLPFRDGIKPGAYREPNNPTAI